MKRETTEIRLDEYNEETHESWLMVRASKLSGSTHLFDSEITHMGWVRVTISRCSRKRDLHHDWIHSGKVLLEFDMSEAQWGAFVSSFGNGNGVPATLTWLVSDTPSTTFGMVPSAPFESRLDESHKEVKESAQKALEDIQEAANELTVAFNGGAGKKAMREAIGKLNVKLAHAPSNMEFAAKSLTEHVENVVTKARADIEGMVLTAQDGQKVIEGSATKMLGGGS
jgi:hypothetical protein